MVATLEVWGAGLFDSSYEVETTAVSKDLILVKYKQFCIKLSGVHFSQAV
jgi:hypothetical protein